MKRTRHACSQCKEIFEDLTELNKHQELSKNQFIDICEVCNQAIPPCVSRTIHIRSHPYCSACGQIFLGSDDFVLHVVLTHQEIVPKNLMIRSKSGGTICYVCGWEFRDSALLEIHLKAAHPVMMVIFQRLK